MKVYPTMFMIRNDLKNRRRVYPTIFMKTKNVIASSHDVSEKKATYTQKEGMETRQPRCHPSRLPFC